jgi:hypothetical protein
MCFLFLYKILWSSSQMDISSIPLIGMDSSLKKKSNLGQYKKKKKKNWF